jgi:hypothetical protein
MKTISIRPILPLEYRKDKNTELFLKVEDSTFGDISKQSGIHYVRWGVKIQDKIFVKLLKFCCWQHPERWVNSEWHDRVINECNALL